MERKIGLQAVNGKFVSADLANGGNVVADHPALSAWQTFQVIELGDYKIGLKAVNGKFVSADFG